MLAVCLNAISCPFQAYGLPSYSTPPLNQQVPSPFLHPANVWCPREGCECLQRPDPRQALFPQYGATHCC